MRIHLISVAVALLLPAGVSPAVAAGHSSAHGVSEVTPAKALGKRDRKLRWAFRNHVSEIQVTCKGVVVAKLPDDVFDIRHQRFLIELKSGQTLLIVHNIDLVKRVKPLRVRDEVIVRGEYIWNEKGGLIHYTHRDPAGVHPTGWIKHRGKVYR